MALSAMVAVPLAISAISAGQSSRPKNDRASDKAPYRIGFRVSAEIVHCRGQALGHYPDQIPALGKGLPHVLIFQGLFTGYDLLQDIVGNGVCPEPPFTWSRFPLYIILRNKLIIGNEPIPQVAFDFLIPTLDSLKNRGGPIRSRYRAANSLTFGTVANYL